MQPFCGHVPDSEEAIAACPAWSELAGALPTTTDDLADLPRFAPPVCAQIANDCCGVATRASAYAVANANGSPIPLPSALALYAGAMLAAGVRAPLPDTGSSLRAMLRWTETNGLASEKRWPEIMDHVVNPETGAREIEVPPLDVFQKGQDVPILRWYTILTGATLGDGLISALSRLRFPVIAMPVDEAFAAIGDRVYTEQGGKLIGNHAMLVCGFVSALDAFILQNSWGEDFGDRGFVLVSRATLNRLAHDAVVIDVIPRGAP